MHPRETFDLVPFVDMLGFELVEAEDGRAEIAVEITERHSSTPDAIVAHGGVVSALVDVAAGAAIVSMTESMAPTIDLRVDYLAPPTADLTAEAEVVNLASNVALADVLVSAGETLVAVGRVLFKVSGATADSPWQYDHAAE